MLDLQTLSHVQTVNIDSCAIFNFHEHTVVEYLILPTHLVGTVQT